MNILNESPSAKVEMYRSWDTAVLKDIVEGLKEDIVHAYAATYRRVLNRELNLVETILKEREQKLLQPCGNDYLPGLE